MRLNDFEIESIKKLAILHFGEGVQVFLFGSRTNDKMRGGDIDLFIKKSGNPHLNVRAKINFITDLILQIGEQKIDVVLDHPEINKTSFYKTIQQTEVQIC